MSSQATVGQAGRKVAKALKSSSRPMTTKKLEAETGLDELRVRLGLSWLREKGYASKDFRNRWTLD